MTPRVEVRKRPRAPLAAQILTALANVDDDASEGTLLMLTDPLVYRLAQRADPARHLRSVLRTMEKRGEVVSTGHGRWRLP